MTIVPPRILLGGTNFVPGYEVPNGCLVRKKLARDALNSQ